MPNTGRCTVSIINPKYTEWEAANRGTSHRLNPNWRKVECPCNKFVAKSAAEPNGKCNECTHLNKFHL
jgi:hypothetical protein